jgi:hypothetical protein
LTRSVPRIRWSVFVADEIDLHSVLPGDTDAVALVTYRARHQSIESVLRAPRVAGQPLGFGDRDNRRSDVGTAFRRRPLIRQGLDELADPETTRVAS